MLAAWAPAVVRLDLATGTRGVFQVHADDELVFDIAEANRFPNPGEIVGILEQRWGPHPEWRATGGVAGRRLHRVKSRVKGRLGRLFAD